MSDASFPICSPLRFLTDLARLFACFCRAFFLLLQLRDDCSHKLALFISTHNILCNLNKARLNIDIACFREINGEIERGIIDGEASSPRKGPGRKGVELPAVSQRWFRPVYPRPTDPEWTMTGIWAPENRSSSSPSSSSSASQRKLA